MHSPDRQKRASVTREVAMADREEGGRKWEAAGDVR